jgi:hypothetical protein
MTIIAGTKIARAVWRLVGSAAIAVAFLVFLTVASAQHEAVQALSGAKTGLSYSVAKDVVSKAEADRTRQQSLKDKNEFLTNDTHRRENMRFALDSDRFARLQDVDLIARSIMRSGQCDLLPANMQLPAVTDLTVWKRVQLCAQQGNVAPNVVKPITDLNAPNANPFTIQQRIDRLDRDVKENADTMALNKVEIDQLTASISSADAARNALQDVLILDRNFLVRALSLTSLPPRVLPIFLTFFAGLFGALLITLVLVVYPNNDLHLTSGHSSFWYRIGLGGLIAVAIYVVLGGGVAMIGSNDSVAIGDTNFMFFCAIGILAGMFSDRAAGFLSDSAGALSSPSASRRGTGPTGVSPPPPPPAPAAVRGTKTGTE